MERQEILAVIEKHLLKSVPGITEKVEEQKTFITKTRDVYFL